MTDQTRAGKPARRRRRWPYVLLGLVLIILAVYAVGWFWAADRARSMAAELLGRPPAGIAVETAGVEVEGFPLVFAVASAPFRISEPSGIAWWGEGIEASVVPWRLPVVSLALAAPQHLAVPGQPALDAVMESDGAGEVVLDFDGRFRSVRLDLPDITVTGPALPGPLGIETATLAAEMPGVAADAIATGVLRLLTIALPVPEVEGLPPAVELAEAQVSVTGAPLVSPRAADMAAWRAAGGRLRIDAVRLVWGPLTVEAVGELVLDADLQPEGSVTVAIRGWRPALEAAVEAGLVARPAAEQLGAALQLFSAQSGSADAEDPAASIALAITDRRVSALFFTVARLPEINWPE